MNKVTPRISKWWVIIIGSGLALTPIHNKALTDLATNSDDEVVFFLPAVAFVLLLMGAGMFLVNNWGQVKAAGWGDKRIAIPLVIIAVSIGLSGVTADGFAAKFAPTGMGLFLIGLYLVSRVLGRGLFVPLAIGAAVASAGIITYQAWRFGAPTGGFVFEQNTDIATGYIMLGTALLVRSKYQWLLAGLALVALVASGAPEAVFAIGIVAVIILIRRDWSKKSLVMVVPIAVAAVLVLGSGYGRGGLYQYVVQTVKGEHTVNVQYDGQLVSASPIEWRAIVAKRALRDLHPLGEGYNLTGFSLDTVHNVPLIIAQQLGYPGVLAGLAWLWVSLFCLIKTRWKYAWTMILALSVFDHYIWTQLVPVWWMLVGISVADDAHSDLVFRSIDA